MARIQLQNISKSYGPVSVLDDINLDIDEGEFIVLVGPSGCGKSTLLRMIAGLETVTGGDILIGDTLVNELRPRERDIAMVFQSYALYPHMDVERNMGFSMEIRKEDKTLRAERVGEAAGILGLGKLLGRTPKALSGGQRQRVAMGRAIVRDPKAFLFDEPLSNLDAALRVEMRLEIAKLHKRLDATMIYVTHDQVEALTLADRIVVMNAGHIQQVGTPMELYDQPHNLFVAQFIGSPNMNIVGTDTMPDALKATLLPKSKQSASAKVAHFGIRPEHTMIIENGEHQLTGQVIIAERLGSDTNVYIEADGIGQMLVRQRGDVSLAAGQQVKVQLDLTKAHYFNADGEALFLREA
ncbi:sn-glycerol-3-phosphate ABC transporter ATP-binding protein UgpC [Cohaesibacter sp. CAU 1516]|uniref:ABC transporter ATP-binding protein n=1 Tax=Cohaesibacter sp. CAU 1516 TaxID=2576038 RepID=UPI0010FE8ADD|nr:sn-glycerol-3-phosphate ABC transporter ATP-binding protein UgpC [Cohaesibacter sp. CAU 1516]TLP48405.1 sn-glycerol-3-phosphate ABC transporter ATP-binding protein UgpC [Cohaesibacter sp. CAU 1516]